MLHIFSGNIAPRLPKFLVLGSQTTTFAPGKIFIAVSEGLTLSNFKRMAIEEREEGADIDGLLGILNGAKVIKKQEAFVLGQIHQRKAAIQSRLVEHTVVAKKVVKW